MTTKMVQGCRCPFNHQQFPLCDLHAAAPDLLAALKGMLDQPETNEAYDTMMQRAQAAIARAEGREEEAP